MNKAGWRLECINIRVEPSIKAAGTLIVAVNSHLEKHYGSSRCFKEGSLTSQRPPRHQSQGSEGENIQRERSDEANASVSPKEGVEEW
mmetsp:Transcript_15826/g.25323  ORF Transcript_15826/g.25323 Transcript_15826/m.25323 type:complete len:88 (+) Transcript_15826:39-302(+)